MIKNKITTLNDWIEQLKTQFTERELNTMVVHKAKIHVALEDVERNSGHVHGLEYISKEAKDLDWGD